MPNRFARNLRTFFPEAVLTEAAGYLLDKWCRLDGNPELLVEFGLDQEFMVPLLSGKQIAADPLIGICAALETLEPGEAGVFQVLFKPVQHRWAESMMRAVTVDGKEPFFENAAELVFLTRQKLSRPLFAVVIRVGVRSHSGARASHIARRLAGVLEIFGSPQTNALVPRLCEEPRDEIVTRSTRCSGMILNGAELASIAHLPTAAVRSQKLLREVKRTKAAPPSVTGDGLALGENLHEGSRVRVALTAEQRVRHCHLIGASGTGKSTLLLNLIAQDIKNGEGVAVLDPHGDLIDNVLSHVPEERINDVILFDPSDAEFPIPFNILSAHSDIEKNLLASDLVAVFQRLSTSWGDQMTSVLGNGILAFLESDRGGTLADLRRFLIEPAFRKEFLQTVGDPEVVYYWHKQFPLLTGKPQGPVLTRLDTFLRPKTIRYMVSQKENKIDFAEVMNGGKIFLAKLSQGAIGEENAYLLGALLVSKFHQMVMGRQGMQESQRRYFWLYADEFHHFVTPSMASILSGARKYRLGLVLAHQGLRQLENRSSEVESAVIANDHTRICFRLGDQDARKLENGFSFFEAKDLQSLGIGEAICRVGESALDFNLSVPRLAEPEQEMGESLRSRILEHSRGSYGVPRLVVETMLARSRPSVEPEPEEAKPKRGRRTSEPEPAETVSPEPTEPVSAQSTELEKTEKAVEPHQTAKEAKQETVSPAPDAEEQTEHERLKDRITAAAEALLYSVTREERVDAHHLRVDLVLRRGTKAIACQIAMTTTAEHESNSVRKALAAGFAQVAVIARTTRRLTNIESVVRGSIEPVLIGRVGFYLADDFIEALQGWASSDPAGGIAESKKPRKQVFRLNATMSTEERRKAEAEMLRDLSEKMKRKK